MANSQSHIVQWKHNRSFLTTISHQYRDWIVTVSFYVAVHAVDTLLATDKIFPTSHDYRNEVLLKTNRYSAIYKAYQPLYTLSRTIRYFADPTKWVRAEDIETQVLGRYLYPLEASVQKLIGQDLKLPKIVFLDSQRGPSDIIHPPR